MTDISFEIKGVTWMSSFDAGMYGSFKSWPEKGKERLRELIKALSSQPPSEWMNSATGADLRTIRKFMGVETNNETLILDKIIDGVNTVFLSRGGPPPTTTSSQGDRMQ
jgi:hypothetical protein